VQSTSCVDPLVSKFETHPATPTYLIVKVNGDAAGGLVLDCYFKMPKGARVRAPEKFQTMLNGECVPCGGVHAHTHGFRS